MATIEVKVPDIGDYEKVPVIEVLVKAGDTVSKDQGLITLESDKATMEVPSSVAGVVKEIKVKLGDEISEGTVVAVIEAEGSASLPPPGEGARRADEGKGIGDVARVGSASPSPALSGHPLPAGE